MARYGKFVLLKPPFDAGTALLWLTPFGVVAGAGLLLWRRRGGGGTDPAVPLSAEEEARLRQLET